MNIFTLVSSSMNSCMRLALNMHTHDPTEMIMSKSNGKTSNLEWNTTLRSALIAWLMELLMMPKVSCIINLLLLQFTNPILQLFLRYDLFPKENLYQSLLFLSQWLSWETAFTINVTFQSSDFTEDDMGSSSDLTSSDILMLKRMYGCGKFWILK